MYDLFTFQQFFKTYFIHKKYLFIPGFPFHLAFFQFVVSFSIFHLYCKISDTRLWILSCRYSAVEVPGTAAILIVIVRLVTAISRQFQKFYVCR